jgi:hypothetical protein
MHLRIGASPGSPSRVVRLFRFATVGGSDTGPKARPTVPRRSKLQLPTPHPRSVSEPL